MIKMRNRRAMSIVEYGAMIAVLVGALVGLSIYLKRSISGHWRQTADVFGFGRQARAPENILWEK